MLLNSVIFLWHEIALASKLSEKMGVSKGYDREIIFIYKVKHL